MEFKNFENKLIIEKITNYCIENNINAQEINSLTAKIKFGKLNESLLLEVDPISAGLGGLALGAGAKTAYNWARGKIGGGFTSTQQYNYAKGIIQQNLQTAITSLDAAHKNLVGNDNIFDKYKIAMSEPKKQDLINAVTQLKTAIDQNIGDVVTSMKTIGGEVSGSSNYGDESPPVDFDLALPELKKSGDLEAAFKNAYSGKISEFNKIKSMIYKNISASLKDKNPSQISAVIEKFKQSIHDATKNLEDSVEREVKDAMDITRKTPANPELARKAYIDLVSLANGKFPASTSTPTGTPAPAPAQVNANTVTQLINLNNINEKIAKIILNNTNINAITKIIQDAYNKGKSTTDIKNSINKSSKQLATIRNATIKSGDIDAKAKELINVIAFNIDQF